MRIEDRHHVPAGAVTPPRASAAAARLRNQRDDALAGRREAILLAESLAARLAQARHQLALADGTDPGTPPACDRPAPVLYGPGGLADARRPEAPVEAPAPKVVVHTVVRTPAGTFLDLFA